MFLLCPFFPHYLASEQLDQGRLAGTVGTNDGNTGSKRTLHADVEQLLLLGTGVLEVNVLHLQDGTLLGLDTLKETRLGELELNLSGFKRVVGSGLGDLLDELRKVTLVTLELVVGFVVNDVGTDVVQETRVVRNLTLAR